MGHMARTETYRVAGNLRIVERMIGGGAVFALPGSSLEVMWPGPGSGMYIGQPRVAGGAVTRIEHHTCAGTFSTLREAQAAVAAFVEAEA